MSWMRIRHKIWVYAPVCLKTAAYLNIRNVHSKYAAEKTNHCSFLCINRNGSSERMRKQDDMSIQLKASCKYSSRCLYNWLSSKSSVTITVPNDQTSHIARTICSADVSYIEGSEVVLPTTAAKVNVMTDIR